MSKAKDLLYCDVCYRHELHKVTGSGDLSQSPVAMYQLEDGGTIVCEDCLDEPGDDFAGAYARRMKGICDD